MELRARTLEPDARTTASSRVRVGVSPESDSYHNHHRDIGARLGARLIAFLWLAALRLVAPRRYTRHKRHQKCAALAAQCSSAWTHGTGSASNETKAGSRKSRHESQYCTVGLVISAPQVLVELHEFAKNRSGAWSVARGGVKCHDGAV